MDKTKKLVLLASLCVVAAVLAPIASASAATKFEGKCNIHGLAKFTEHNLTTKLEKNAYKFGSTRSKVEEEAKEKGAGAVCEQKTSGTKFYGEAEVHGKGELSCETAKSTEEGPGKLNLSKSGEAPWEIEANFKLTFTATAGVVTLHIHNAAKTETAEGTATFGASLEEPAAQCFVGAGIKKAEFVATTKEGTVGE